MSKDFQDWAQEAVRAADLAGRTAGVLHGAWSNARTLPLQALAETADEAASALIAAAEEARLVSHKTLEQYYEEMKAQKAPKDGD